jgi:hypothetical protein
MKKQKKQPSPAALQKQREEKRAAILRAVRKCGKAVRRSFVRRIKEAGKMTAEQAEIEFERLLNAGHIVRSGTNATGDVDFYEMKKT